MLVPMRVRRGDLQMPTFSLQNSAGHRIEVIGLAHLAVEGFWSDLTEHIEGLQQDGYVVHFETIFVDEEGDPEQVASLERELDNMDFIAGVLGLQHQGEALERGEDWINVDLPGEDIAEAGLVKMHGDVRSDVLRLKETGRWRVVRLLDLFLRRGMWFVETWATIKPKKGDEVLMSRRSSQAVQVAMAESAPVVMLWGAAHLKEIVELLGKAGYRKTGVSWRTAMHPARKDEVLARLVQIESGDVVPAS